MIEDLGRKCRRAINFDLSEELLKQHYSPTKYKKAWGEIAVYMDKHGFDHRQYSGYVSRNPMTELETNKFLQKMANDLPWLGSCARVFDVTEVGRTYDCLDILQNNRTIDDPILSSSEDKDINIKQQQKTDIKKGTATFTRKALKKEAKDVHKKNANKNKGIENTTPKKKNHQEL